MGGVVDYLELCRPKNLLLAGLTVPLGALFAVESQVSSYPYSIVAAHTLAVVAFTAAGNTMNDIKDLDIDTTAHPSRPLPAGRVTVKNAKTFAIFLWLMSVLGLAQGIGLLYDGNGLSADDLPSVAIYMIAIILMMTYDHGPATKNQGLTGNIVISMLVAAVLLYGAAGVGSIWQPHLWWIFGTIFFVNLAREIVKDCFDMESDEGRRETFPMSVGKEKARMFAYVFIMAGLVCLYIPFWKGPFVFGQLLLQSPAILVLISLNGPMFNGEDELVISRIRVGMLLGLMGFTAAVLI